MEPVQELPHCAEALIDWIKCLRVLLSDGPDYLLLFGLHLLKLNLQLLIPGSKFVTLYSFLFQRVAEKIQFPFPSIPGRASAFCILKLASDPPDYWYLPIGKFL